ncbi:aldose 1-epimerase family protein [Psychroserpens sp. SPM9]|uniref:aldose 1-epimerase family protein n=1 Tax=Psychroserpens sp. SPM9 TaxID=2975598 RepID=UPI0021A5978D|nr:aldose 1-epimerase family protein [Psychroserpens sp. SPM9]MDG5490071.1 aldose 1-epimerase family protein [Psychroserpens sp. SPM9]
MKKVIIRSFQIFCMLILLVSCNNKKEQLKDINDVNVKITEKNDLTLENTMAIHTLKNNETSASFKTKGAEMISFKTDDLEYVWQADPEVWPRHAPILFPIVGRLKDHEYTYKDKTYPMKQHGFARDNDFKVVEKTETSITFEQVATDESKTIYPFDFVLQVKYILEGKSLQTEYIVKNPSTSEDLYFTIGAHPGFNCPFEEGQKRNEYQLVFDEKISPKFHSNVKGLYEGDTYEVFEEDGIMKLPDTIFDKGSLTFNPNKFSKVIFVHEPTQKKYLSVEFKGFPYLGIWSPNDSSPFVCIEPWYGIADRKDHNKDYRQKDGVMKLAPNDTFNCSFSIEIL